MSKLPAGWKLSRLEELATVERGKFSARPRNDPKFFGGDIPFVQTGEVSAAGTYLINHKQTLNELGKTVSKVFPKDSILITIAANIGETAITTYEVACPDSVVAIIPKPAKAHVFWLKKVLETLKYDLDSKATQNAQKNINLEVLRPLEIATPPIEEQTKIAQILSAWDKAITTTERLLANSQQQKQALMQQLLTGQKRFAGFKEKWTSMLLEEMENQKLVTLGRGNVISKKDIASNPGSNPIYSSSVKNDGLFGTYGNHMFDEELITWSVDGGGNFFYRKKHKFSITNVSGFMRIDTSKLDYRFLAASLEAIHATLAFDYQSKAHPSVIRKVYKLNFPSLPEQQKIAQVLSTADAEIANLQAQLATLKLEKKALMQQLLTGQRRVKPDADAAA